MAELDRAKIVHENFIHCVRAGNLPAAKSSTSLREAELSEEMFLDLFDAQLKSRHLDLIARRLKQDNQVFYTIGSSGHEGNAAIAQAFSVNDTAFLHYRSGAFMLQRAKAKPEINMVYDILLSLAASADDPIAAGRHKVFGSRALNVPPQTSTIASHLPKAVGMAFSIARARELRIEAQAADDSVVLCSFGDASVNHSVAQGAFNMAEWIAHSHYPLPLVFICEDNGLGISVATPPDWIASAMAHRQHLHYLPCDGLNLADVYQKARQAAYIARIKKRPVFLHMKTVRLLGHAGSDIESQYLSQQQIETAEFNDPLLHSARVILENQLLNAEAIVERYQNVGREVERLAEKAVNRPKLNSAAAVMDALIPAPKSRTPAPFPEEEKRRKIFGELYAQLQQKRNLSQIINLALRDLMLQYPHALIFGEDVAKKGGVYRVTQGLMQCFGRRRVFDTLLDETSILGNAMGFAMNGFLPVPEIQFLAYYHNAEDQIRGEAASLSFFSNGQYTNPMVIRIAGLAYQKGFGGHFHNDNSIAALRDVPGLIIACPSHGTDAVKMLRTAFDLAERQRRIVVFLEPIALYMTKDLHESGDNLWLSTYPDLKETIAHGEIGVYGEDEDGVIISYGNGYYLSRQAQRILQERYQLHLKVIDLRWLAPLPTVALYEAIKSARKILIVDECRRTGSVSEELLSWMLENLYPLPRIKRVTAYDTYIPLGPSWESVLPGKDDIIQAMLELVNSDPQEN